MSTTPISNAPGQDRASSPHSGSSGEGGSHGNASSRSHEQSQRVRHSRSRAGCLTCRKRRKLCDFERDVCGACERLKLQCLWPDSGSSAQDIQVPRLRKRGPSRSIETPANVTTISPMQLSTTNNMWGSFDPVPNVPNMQQQVDFSSFLTNPFGESSQHALQQWAAELLDCGTALDPWTLDSVLAQPIPDKFDADNKHTTGMSPLDSPLSRRPNLHTDPTHRPLLTHYQDCLSRLVACNPDDATNGFDAFTTLASATASTPSGRALHLATLAWAGCHMSNNGQDQYEALSERIAEESKRIIISMPMEPMGLPLDWNSRFDKMATLGAILMVVSFKICRGDIWGYNELNQRLGNLSGQLFDASPESVELVTKNSMLFGFFESMVYHDILCTSSLLEPGPLVPVATIEAIGLAAPENPNTLMGTSLRLFCLLRKTLDLVRSTRHMRAREVGDEELADLVTSATELEQTGLAEKTRYADLVKSRAEVYDAWQYMHEGFRVATLLALRSFALGNPPHSTQIRLLVRQALSLLETMYEQNLPGFCSAHFVIFVTGLCAAPGGVRDGQLDDRQRVERLYESTLDELGFKNVERSRHVVRLVWKRNQERRLFVDWLDIIQLYNWELYLV